MRRDGRANVAAKDQRNGNGKREDAGVDKADDHVGGGAGRLQYSRDEGALEKVRDGTAFLRVEECLEFFAGGRPQTERHEDQTEIKEREEAADLKEESALVDGLNGEAEAVVGGDFRPEIAFAGNFRAFYENFDLAVFVGSQSVGAEFYFGRGSLTEEVDGNVGSGTPVVVAETKGKGFLAGEPANGLLIVARDEYAPVERESRFFLSAVRQTEAGLGVVCAGSRRDLYDRLGEAFFVGLDAVLVGEGDGPVVRLERDLDARNGPAGGIEDFDRHALDLGRVAEAAVGVLRFKAVGNSARLRAGG